MDRKTKSYAKQVIWLSSKLRLKNEVMSDITLPSLPPRSSLVRLPCAVVHMIKSTRSLQDIRGVISDYLLTDEVDKFMSMLEEGTIFHSLWISISIIYPQLTVSPKFCFSQLFSYFFVFHLGAPIDSSGWMFLEAERPCALS